MSEFPVRRPRSPRKHPGWLLPGVILGMLGTGVREAAAVQATLDYQDNRQTARTESETFESYWRRQSVSAQQSVPLAAPLLFDLRFWALREVAGGDASGTDESSVRRTVQPEGTLSYRTHRFQTGLRGSWYRRRAEGVTTLPPETRRDQEGAWLDLELPTGTQISANGLRTHSEDDPDGTDSPGREQSDRTGYARARQNLPGSWQTEYLFTGMSSDLNVDASKRTFLSHALELRGSPTFEDGRLRTYLRARSLFLSQEIETGIGAGNSVYRSPLEATLVLDDTPESLDPLEDDPTPIPALFDRDRETATSINLGSSATAVREFGGDYRNIAYDFGEPQTFASAFLFVDTRVPNPELFRWRIFSTDDPDGRLWEELGTDRVQVTYTELGSIVQGWQITFRGEVTGRFFKMVDVKLGPALPDLHVTELEFYVRADAVEPFRSEDSQDWRLEARAGYALTPEVEVGYDTRLRARRFDDDARNVDDMDHGVRSTWTRGRYAFAGRVDWRKVDSPANRRNTDVMAYQLSATRQRSERLSGAATWNRTSDTSAGRDQTTDSYSVDATWKAAPGLRWTERASYGHRTDNALDRTGSSWSVSHRLEAFPVRALSLEADRTDRWVDEELGSGFQRFSDTVAEAAWSPVPLVSVTGDFRYQEREESDWTTRESVMWTPFARGDLRPTLTADSFYDSRFRSWEPGASATVKWFVRRGLVAEARVGIRRYELDGEETLPVDTRIHVNWSL